MNAPATYQGSPAFSEQELACYGQFFSQVDAAGTGRVSGLQAAGFLSASGLERKVLKQVWDLADTASRGELGPEEFCIACRLVAHAQAGRQVSGDLAYQEPLGPPHFEALGGVAGAPATAARPSARQRGRSPPPGEDRSLPTARDLRKYGRLFYSRVVLNGGQAMGAAEAKDLFERSGLGNEALQQIWYLSDHDSDGQLSWPEFVLSMHLIRRALSGQSLPQPPANLPRDLVELLGSLDSPEAYARQPSRSPRSMSGASTPFGSASPERPGTEQALSGSGGFGGGGFGGGAGGFGGGGEAASGPAGFGGGDFGGSASGFGAGGEAVPPPPVAWGGTLADFGTSAGPDMSASGFGDGFGAGSPGSPSAKLGDSPSKPGRHGRKSRDEDAGGFGGFGESGAFSELPRQSRQTVAPSFDDESAFGPDIGSAAEPSSSSRPGRSRKKDDHFDDDRRSEEHRSPDFGERFRLDNGLSMVAPSNQPVEHLEVLIEAEKKLVHRLRLDTDALDQELGGLEEACREEERAAAREKAECDRIGREREILWQQLEASQRQLSELKAEHKGLHIESVLLRRDTDHYSKEAAFLQRLLDEGARDSQVLQQSIEYLEQSNQSLTAHTKALEEARKDVLAQVMSEKELMRKEEREALLVKSALETLRAGGGAESLARFAASRQANEPQGQGRSRLSSGVAAPWSEGFSAPPEAGGGALFSELGLPPAPPLPALGKDLPGGRPPSRVPPSMQLREGV